MKKMMEMVSYLSLVLLVTAPVLFYAERIDLSRGKFLMTVATVTWFVSALCWMGKEKENVQ